MPRDENGVYADIVTDSASVISRMNIGRLFEHQICGAARDVRIRMHRLLGQEKISKEELMTKPDSLVDQLWGMFIELYGCVGGGAFRMYQSLTSKADRSEVLARAITKNIVLHTPIGHEKSFFDIAKDVERIIKPTYGQVIYNDPETGELIKTEKKIRIGVQYVMLLNKIADDGSSVAIAKQQHFGIPTSATKHDKHSSAWRNSPVRADGESEVRIKLGYAGEELQAETMDLSNSSMTQREIYTQLLTHDTPSNIPRIIDREKFPLGTSRPIQNIQHALMCAGLRMESVPDINLEK